MQRPRMNTRRWLVTTAIAAGAAVGGFAIAGAATSPSSTTAGPTGATATSTTTKFRGNENSAHESSESAEREAAEKVGAAEYGGHDRSGHGNETVVTGATADRIKAAALAAAPGTVSKTEQRSDGTYEAEITKTDGSEVHISLGKNFAVTSTNSRGSHGHDGGAESAGP